MITLIAEAKTMRRDVRPSGAASVIPSGERRAADICAAMASMEVGELARMLKVSPGLALAARSMAYDFRHAGMGLEAIDAFTGVVFRYLDADSLEAADRKYASAHLYIVSSLYGLLSADASVRPYRLDYSVKMGPAGESMWQLQRSPVTDALRHLLSVNECTEVLDLMPAEAARCVDFGRIRERAAVYTVAFKEVTGPQAMRTPSSNRLKQVRGIMARHIITRRIDCIADLKTLECDEFVYDGNLSEGDILVFLC